MPVSPLAVSATPVLAQSRVLPQAPALTASQRLAGLAALGLGLFLIWGAGFAGAAVLHDTAHDVRHGFGFPCH